MKNSAGRRIEDEAAAVARAEAQAEQDRIALERLESRLRYLGSK